MNSTPNNQVELKNSQSKVLNASANVLAYKIKQDSNESKVLLIS